MKEIDGLIEYVASEIKYEDFRSKVYDVSDSVKLAKRILSYPNLAIVINRGNSQVETVRIANHLDK